MCRTALRGCGRRCRRRLSGIWPSRGAKAELRFWRALSAANRGTMTHDLFLLVVLLHFGAVIPPLCATREQREQGPLQEGDAGEREGEGADGAKYGAGVGPQDRAATSSSTTAPGSGNRGHQKQQSSPPHQRRAGRPLAFWDKTRAWSAGMRRIQRQ